MKIIGVVVATLILLLLMAWWLGMSLDSINQAMTVSQGVDGSQDDETVSGKGPVEYTKQKVKEINEVIVGTGEEVEQIIP